MALWSSTKLNIAPDNGAHYNTSSGKYCAEYYGTYIFQLHLYKTSPTETLSCDIKKDHDGSLETLVRVSARPDTLTGSSSTIVDLQNGDCVYVGECTNFHKLNSMTSFSGALLDLLD